MADPTPDPALKDQLKAAFKAFKKRLKLTRLEEESKIGRSPTTGGRSSGIIGITPPVEYPQAIWDELVKQGKLKRSGPGLYELGEQAG